MERRLVRITLEYDGAAYHGWQRQRDEPTVQGELEKALSTIRRAPISVVGQGRTDAGVHAEAQVAHAILDSDDVNLEDLKRRLNGILGPTCTVREILLAPEGFHARYSALSRHYRYQIIQVYSPLRRSTHWYVESELDLKPIEEAAGLCTGEHDFGMFCSHSQKMNHTRCIVSAFTLEAEWPFVTLRAAANRFLHNMVRRLAGEFVLIGRTERSVEEFESRLNRPGPAQAGLTAPPHALFLERVVYPE